MKAENADQGRHYVSKPEEQSAFTHLGQCGAPERAAQLTTDFVHPAPL